MTRDEAIVYIAIEKARIEYSPGSDHTVKALEMAIEALKQQPEQFTYDEACIFLSAIEKERRAIKRMKNYIFGQDDKKNLNHIVDEIVRKVQAALWEWEQ